MADTKISDFTDGGDVQSGDAVAAARAGGNVRVTVPTQSAIDASVATKAPLQWTINAMGALAMNAAPYVLNTKSISANSTLTQSGMVSGGPYMLLLQNTDPSNARVITLPSGGGLAFFSQGLGAVRTTFTIPASGTVLIRFVPNTSTAVTMQGETVLFSNLGAASAIDPTVDLQVIEQAGLDRKATPKEIADAFSTNLTVPVFGTIGLKTDFWSNPGSVVLYALDDPVADYGIYIGSGNGDGTGGMRFSGVGAIFTARGSYTTPTLAPSTNIDTVKNNTTFLTVLTAPSVFPGVLFLESDLTITADAVGSAKVSLVVAGALTSMAVQAIAINSATGAVLAAARITSSGATFSVPAGTTGITVTLRGPIITTTAGNISVEFAQLVANGNSTLLAGAAMQVRT